MGVILNQSSQNCSAPMFQCLDLDDGLQQGWYELDRKKSHGASSMPNILEWPNDAVVSSLSSVLEATVHPKYFLSARACAGILRRAQKRGKAIPPLLERSLRAAAGWSDRQGTATS